MKATSASVGGLLEPVRATFRAVARTVVPDTATLDDADWALLESIVEGALAERPARVRRQLVGFVRLIDWMALARHRRRFRFLSTDARVRLLERLQNSPVLLLRRGFWGLRTLVYMGWYAQPSTANRLGYRGGKGGWGARPGLLPSTPLPDVAPAREPTRPSVHPGPPASPRAPRLP